MRKFLLFLAMCMYPLFAMADSEYYTDEARQILDSSIEFTDSLHQEYAELEKQILALDPDYAKKLTSKKLTDEQKLTMARSYLAQKAFDYYKDTFMSELEQRGKETGRKISTKSFEPNQDYNFTEKFWWLDRGKLDTAECHKDGNINDFPICKYPDGFEEYLINVKEYNQKDKNGKKALSGNNFYTKILTYDKDIRDKNAHQYCHIGLQYESVNRSSTTDSIFFDELYLDLACDVTKYDEHYTQVNQEVEDTINGKHDIIRTEKMSDGRVRLVERQEEDMSKWQSNYIPEGYVINRSYMQRSQKEHHIIEGAE